MADVSHELGSLRFVVDAPLASKVAMFNNQVNQHMQSQLLNPFSQTDGRVSPKPQFSKDEYGKPLAGSLTEMRGQKANIHVMKEMLELCQIINTEGYSVKDEPKMRVIPFGELFNIYNYISDKVVGILLRARKHKLVQFEGEMLFQRRDDDVPIFLLKPIGEIRELLENKIAEIKRATSPLPQATSVLLDKSAHMQKLKDGSADGSLSVPRFSYSPSPTQSPAPSINGSRASTPQIPLANVEMRVNELKPKAADERKIVVDSTASNSTNDTEAVTEVQNSKAAEITERRGSIRKDEELRKEEAVKTETNNTQIPSVAEQKQQCDNTMKSEAEDLTETTPPCQDAQEIEKVNLNKDENIVAPPRLPSSPPPNNEISVTAETNINCSDDNAEERSPTPIKPISETINTVNSTKDSEISEEAEGITAKTADNSIEVNENSTKTLEITAEAGKESTEVTGNTT